MTTFIAEASSNYCASGVRSKGRALALIRDAKKSGADIIKFQYFRPELYSKEYAPLAVKALDEIRIPKSWIPELKQQCDILDIEFMCSVFHPDDVPYINKFVNRHKIASWELFCEPHINPLFLAIAETKKPVIMSTAGATMEEIDWCANILIDNGTPTEDLTIMHCDPGYPVQVQEMQLKRILDIGTEFFPCQVGYSAHVVSPTLVAASVLYQAKVIEVHFDCEDGQGHESAHSYTPSQFQQLVKQAQLFSQTGRS
jgi:sialic acid synthase SpsE